MHIYKLCRHKYIVSRIRKKTLKFHWQLTNVYDIILQGICVSVVKKIQLPKFKNISNRYMRTCEVEPEDKHKVILDFLLKVIVPFHLSC